MAEPSLKILLVDDEKNIRQTLVVTLQSWGHVVTPVATADEALRALKSETYELVLTDFKLGTKSGLEVVKAARQADPGLISVLMTAFASFENAVKAIKEGAYDYLPKPFSNSQLAHLLERVGKLVALKRENALLREGGGQSGARADYFAGQTSPAMARLEEFVRKIGPTEANILLVGESGTGKTELAKLIHSRSPRKQHPFGVVNCTSLSETLLESELFGHVRGAFTGAFQDHIGRLEAVNNGTVLIDEVGELSLNGQTRLLRFLQEKIVERVGSTKPIQLDVRVVAATNRNLEEAVREGKFREDLYFRLNIFECQLVPLRYRKEDLPILIERFVREAVLRVPSRAGSQGTLELPTVPPNVLKRLQEYPWPGNVRELRNVMERLVLLAAGRQMSVADLPDSVRDPDHRITLSGHVEFRTLDELEREQIERVLAVEQNQERAAKILGITTVTLWRKRKQYGLP